MMKMGKFKTKDIIFTDTRGVAKEYAPKPAIRLIPKWYREMESSFPDKNFWGRKPDELLTIKKCMPVLDAITAGYIIVSPCDVYVSMKDDEPSFHSSIPNLISFHPRKQAYLHPHANQFRFPKWENVWSIKTPKGYSCLFIPPMHHQNQDFEILEGIVDTDEYSVEVNFPFVLKNPTLERLIPAGTPIAQVIPFKRDEWQSIFLEKTGEPEKVKRLLDSRLHTRYKHLFWKRKSYL